MGFHQYQTNFAGGIQSPYMASRSDFKKYQNGAEDIFNAVVKVSGGAVRRAGTLFIAQAKSRAAFQQSAFQDSAFQITPNAKLTLVPFIFNTQEAYVLEFGAGYIRFFRNRRQILGTGSGSELVLNGNFDTDLANWTLQQDNGATVTWVAGQAQLQPGAAGTAGLSQTISGLDPGTTYVLNFLWGGIGIFQVGTTLGAGDVVADTPLTGGTFKATFVAPPGGQVTIYWRSSEPNSTDQLDSVSMLSAVPLELATTYTAAQLRSLRFAQSADVLYICHPAHPIRKLTRLSDTVWTLQEVLLNPPPSEEVDLEPPATLTPAATTGLNVQFDASASVFLAADIHRQIKSQGGVAVINVVNSGTQVHADILQPFINTNPIPQGLWSMDGSPSTNLTLSAAGPVNASITVTAAIAAFRSSDVGAFIIGLDGIAEITAVNTATDVTAKVLKVFTGTSLVSGAWFLKFESFSAGLGFPDVPVFFEQRLWFLKGNDVHGSVSGDFENFAEGSNDDDAVRFPIAGRVDSIRWAKALKNFVIGTIGSEYKVDGGDELAITPTNVHAAPQSDWGCDPEPDAVTAGIASLFVQRGRANIREMAFDFTKDGYESPDITILADHLFGSGILQLARAGAPDSFVMGVMGDGSLNICTYERKEDVVAWCRATPGVSSFGAGKYVSATVIPAKCGTGDEIWVAVERTLNGRTEIYIEVFDGQLNTDCALVHDGDESLATTFTGFSHLSNEQVDVLTTGQSAFQRSAFQTPGAFQKRRVKFQPLTMDGTGSVEIPAPGATKIEAGLHYDTLVKTLRPDPGGQQGTMMFQKKRSNTVYVRFFCSGGAGIKVNNQKVRQGDLEAREIYDHTREANLGWDRDGQVTIEQTEPFPMTVLGVAYSWQVSDGDAP